ncbi:MAG: hypothetical protein K2J99_08155 [Lachnospiraceae bacterium]|nr:hypothetical protein [Lachnospiraceae bacterium]
MNTISSNSSYAYRSAPQAEKQNHVRIRYSNLESTAKQLYEDSQTVSTESSGISMQEAYERLSGTGKALIEAGQDEECKDKPVEESDVKGLAASAGLSPDTKVTEISVASLPNGVSFYFNEDTGEVSCVNDRDSRPGRHALWSKTLSHEEMEKCDMLFDNYKDVAAGGFVFRYRAYLKHEEFWDMYLEDKVDLTTLIEYDDTLSEDELYNKFLKDMRNDRTVIKPCSESENLQTVFQPIDKNNA